jgi:tRNA threonylcarbamoyladenosine modification (KEOPS) complex Cgi121 subunit
MVSLQTYQAKVSGTLLAHKADVDLLLRFSQTTQISEALEKAGYKEGQALAFIALGPRREIVNIRRKLSGMETKIPSRSLTTRELDAIECAALLGTART